MIKTDKDDVKIKECFLIRIKVKAAVLGVILLENLQRKQDFEFLPFIVSFRKFSMQSLLSAFLPWFGEQCLCAGCLGPCSCCRGCGGHVMSRMDPDPRNTPWTERGCSVLAAHSLLTGQLGHVWPPGDLQSRSPRVHPANEGLSLPMPPPPAWPFPQRDHGQARGQRA